MISTNAQYIFASVKTLKENNREKEPNFPNAKYIWPLYFCRYHFVRTFTVKKKIKSVEVAFLSDNIFDIYINGNNIASEVKHLSFFDITKYIVDGQNILHIRGYQSNDIKTFSSAITGGIRITYLDGEKEEIVTDENFLCKRYVGFFKNEEPIDFATSLEGIKQDITVSDFHPIAIRKSFYFIKHFSIKDNIKSAKLFASSYGVYIPYINGNRIGNAEFVSNCANNKKEYQTFNIPLAYLNKDNAIGVIIGNGHYNCSNTACISCNQLKYIATLEIKYLDGTVQYIDTDNSWKCISSPLIDNDLQFGERYDANKETKNWCDYNLKYYDKLETVNTEKNNDKFIKTNYPVVKRKNLFEIKKFSLLDEKTPIYDRKKIISGRATIYFSGLRKGQIIRIRYAERLRDNKPDIGIYTSPYYPIDSFPNGKNENLIKNTDVYIAKGENEEVFSPHFTYTGFRYVYIEGLDNISQIKKVVCFELFNDLKKTGYIYSSNKDIMKLYKTAERSWLNNIVNGPTDCPTREKNYWTGDAQVFAPTACYLYDCDKFLSRWTLYGNKMHEGPYGWEDELYEIPLTLYKYYGNKTILKDQFKKMLALLKKREEYKGMILPTNGIGFQYNDASSPNGITPNTEFFGGCWHCHSLLSISYIAHILGKEELSKELKKKAEISILEFNKRHLLANRNDYDAKCQAGIVLPLAFNIAPNEMREKLAKKLVQYIINNDYHISTGFISSKYILSLLCDFDYKDVAIKVLLNKTYPSWLNIIFTGATCFTESWKGLKEDFFYASMSHYFHGSIISFIFGYIAGINIVGVKDNKLQIKISPHFIKEIGDIKAIYKSKFGNITVSWKYEGDSSPKLTYSAGKNIEIIKD